MLTLGQLIMANERGPQIVNYPGKGSVFETVSRRLVDGE
jgi:hypothetical protein